MDRKGFAVVRTALVAAGFVTLWLWLLPRWMVGSHAFDEPRPLGWIVFVAGLGLAFRCAFEFAWRGLGTPAPFDPPRRLVVSGPYRFVRNPMYIGMCLAIIGEGVTFPRLSTATLILLAALLILATLFIVFYEEPALRRLFGDDYIEYCRHVRRWLPRLTPFDNAAKAAVH